MKRPIQRFLSPLLLVAASVCSAADMPIPAPPAIGARGYLVVEHNSGRVLAEKNATGRLEPASITKLMTAYVVFQKLHEQMLALHDTVVVSEKAWRTQGSRMFIEVGKQVSVEELIQGMIVQSGNDASVALAEHIAGSEDAFATLMNQYAQRLGMTGTHYANSTGLPDDEHYTTARDIAILTSAIIDEFPDHYKWYSQRDFEYNGIKQYNRNKLLWRDASVDGVKTGRTEAAGFCLVSSAKRGDMRVIAVVLGLPSEKAREESSQSLINYAFNFYETHRLYEQGQKIASARVWKGTQDQAALGLRQDLYVTIPRGEYDNLNAVLDLADKLVAPLSTGSAIGAVRVSLNDTLLAEEPLHPLDPVEQGSILRRAIDEVMLWFE